MRSPAAMRDLAIAAALFALIALWRWHNDDDYAAIGFLYLVPAALLALRFALAGAGVGLLVSLALTLAWASQQALDVSEIRYAASGVTTLVVGLMIGMQVRRRRQLEDELWALVRQDDLTGVANRRGWEQRLDDELSAARAAGTGLTLILIDLDDLKGTNDRGGHAAGDRLLAESATAWKEVLGRQDFIARLGGDEFAVLLPERGSDVDAVVAGLRGGVPPGNSVSLGVARWDGDESAERLMARADERLYAAKAAGHSV